MLVQKISQVSDTETWELQGPKEEKSISLPWHEVSNGGQQWSNLPSRQMNDFFSKGEQKKIGQLPDLVDSSFEWDGGGGGGTATVILVLSPPAERLAAWLLLKFDLNFAKARRVVGLYCFSFGSLITF